MTLQEIEALRRDARNHLSNGTGCPSCVEGIERLSGALLSVLAAADQWEWEADNLAQWRGRGYAERLRDSVDHSLTPTPCPVCDGAGVVDTSPPGAEHAPSQEDA